MRTKLIITILTLVVMNPNISFGAISDVETAILKQDFKAAKALAQEVLNFAVVKKDVANQAMYYLGISHLRLDEYSNGVKVFKQLLKEEPNDNIRDKSYIGLYDCYYQQGKYKSAVRAITKLLKVNSRSKYMSLVYLKAARGHLKLSNWKEAREYLNLIIERFPNSFEYHIANQLIEEKQYFAVQVGAFVERQRAEEVLNSLLRRDQYAYIVETMDRNKTKFYRVRVGQLTILDEAERLKSKLSKLGYPTRIYP